MGGIISAIYVGTITEPIYGPYISIVFPGLGSLTWGQKAGYQLAGLAVAVSVAIVTGILTGFLIKSSCFDELKTVFDDEDIWHLEEDDHEYNKIKKYLHRAVSSDNLPLTGRSEKYLERPDPERNHLKAKPNEINIELRSDKKLDKIE